MYPFEITYTVRPEKKKIESLKLSQDETQAIREKKGKFKPWGWCRVEVKAVFKEDPSFYATSTGSCLSYKSEEDYLESEDYEYAVNCVNRLLMQGIAENYTLVQAARAGTLTLNGKPYTAEDFKLTSDEVEKKFFPDGILEDI